MQPAEEERQKTPRKTLDPRLVLVAIVLIVVAFLLGWLPADRKLRSTESTLGTTELELRLANLHRKLGVASHEAARGDFAASGIAAMQFFEQCRVVAESDALATRPRTANAIGAYAGYRDEVLARIAASDPDIQNHLASLYLTLDGVLHRRE